ncbi:MAG: 6-carboxytetrahydropterin synthase [Candidatus Heimdallarchaeota archaeon]|nr:6-carboxytetrahydropterin synthase [Candidatus Heimdallarchaeota archaeon]MCK4954276.1 6-carboxytetrahydropterin synthase [Candidatus Heimdallarchaeota archaeon]
MSYDLFLSRDYFTFSCAHLVIGEKFYETLHGHNYKLLVNVYGTQGKDNMVINFHSIKRILKPLVDSLDHFILIPSNNKLLQISEKGEQITVQIPHLDKEYEFPKSDVVILQIENTTVEELSHYFVKMLAQNEELKQDNISQITVTVFEYEGQGVTTELFPVH